MAPVPTHFVGLSGFASPTTRQNITAAHATHQELLRCYARLFRSVEMDSAFYRAPSSETVQQWASCTPEDFRCSVRMSRAATHVHGLRDPAPIAEFLHALTPLDSRLSCVLFTTPPTMGCDVDLIQSVLTRIPAGIRTAWEFRDQSWICPAVLETLVEHGAAPVVVETLDGVTGEELLPGGWAGEKWQLPFVYVRLRRERYRVSDVVSWAEVLRPALSRGADVYTYFRQSVEAPSYATALDEVLTDASG